MSLPVNPEENLGIEELIFILRGKKVMIDNDLAQLFGVETKYLNRQVRRNHKRFPEEYIFRCRRGRKRNW